jgi:hypothetical protein
MILSLLLDYFIIEKHGNKRVKGGSIICAFAALIFISLALPLDSGVILPNLRAAVDIDTSGDGSAAAFDGEESIATDGDSFCSITNDIEGGKFSSLFEEIAGDCDDSQIPNQFLVEYSYSKNPVKIGENTYFTITVKDKETGNPISNALVKLAIGPAPPEFGVSTAFAAAAATTSTQEEAAEDKTIQTMYTDNNGHATFTVQLGPKSDMGIYDTEIEVTKDTYQSNFDQTNLRVV